MKSSPIYNIIHNDSRKSDCSFGSADGFTQYVQVGTSASNSHTLGKLTVERFVNTNNEVEFRLWVDDTMVRRGILRNKTFEHYAPFGLDGKVAKIA